MVNGQVISHSFSSKWKTIEDPKRFNATIMFNTDIVCSENISHLQFEITFIFLLFNEELKWNNEPEGAIQCRAVHTHTKLITETANFIISHFNSNFSIQRTFCTLQ